MVMTVRVGRGRFVAADCVFLSYSGIGGGRRRLRGDCHSIMLLLFGKSASRFSSLPSRQVRSVLHIDPLWYGKKKGGVRVRGGGGSEKLMWLPVTWRPSPEVWK